MTTTTLNADQGELSKFGDLAHRWWDRTGEFRPLHDINPLRLDWIESVQRLAGMKILDVGCGGGILTDAMGRRGAAEVLGIDLSPKVLQVARLHALEAETPNVRYDEIAVEALAAATPAAYDVVTCMEMLEHVPDPASVVAACAASVRPGGTAFFSTIDRQPKSFLYAIVGAEHVLGLLPKGTHAYDKFIRPSELARACRHAGLETVAQRGMTYNPLTRRYRLVDDTSVNYMVACRRPA